MTVMADAATPDGLGGSFERDRVALYGQFQATPFDPATGAGPDELNHGGLLRKLRNRRCAQAQAGPLKIEADGFAVREEPGIGRGLLDRGPIPPGGENMFAGGPTGLPAKARRARGDPGDAITAAQQAFYEAVEGVCFTTMSRFEQDPFIARNAQEG